MVPTTTISGAVLLDRAWAELGQAQWQAAQATFETALADDETPEAFEGLSWAAWWLDDAETVFTSRERAYRLYRRRGNAAAAARMAIWLAADQLDFHGAWAVASGWLSRAHRLLDPLDPCPDHGWLAFHEGYIAHGQGDTDGARMHGALAADIGRQFDVPDLEMLGLALEGTALVAAAEIDEGMACLDEAAATALEGNAAIPISSAWTWCLLVSACTSVLDYDRAYEWAARVAEFAERHGSRYMLAFCRTEYGSIHLWRGEWPEAEVMLEGGLDAFSRSRPAWATAPLIGLAELRRRQGRATEAEHLLSRAGSGLPARLCRARLALDRGETLTAVELVERVLRHTPDERRLARFPACELLVDAHLAHGDLAEAIAALDELRELGRLVGTPAVQACVARAGGLVAAATGDHSAARLLFEDAIDGFQRSRSPYETARVRIELAATLIALGRADAAAGEARAALNALLGIGADVEARRARRLLDAAAAGSHPSASVTPRQREVLVLLAEGLTNRQIAERLVVSEHTVHRHITNILRRLDLPSRTAAATYAVRSGLVEDLGA